MLQAVVVEDTVIDTLTGSTLTVYFLVFFGVPWNPGIETEATVILYVDGAPIVSGRTFFCMGAGFYASAFEWAAVFVCILYGIVAPWAHFMPDRAEGMPGFVESDVCRGVF